MLAALIAEIELDADSQIRKPSSIQVQELRSNLYQLAAQADESQLSELTDLNLTSPTDETGSSPDFFHRSSATTSSLTSASENPPLNSFDSPLGFLKAALPDVSTRTLNAALLQAGIGQGDEPDMWEIITDILSRESIREMEERGIEGLDGDEDLAYQLRDDEITWETVVSKKKKPRETIKAKKPRASRATKFSIVDIRQRQHGQPRNKNKPSSAVPDPWVQLSSLAEYVSSFVTPHPASLFLSFFHAPNYSTPYEALRNALNSICRSTTAQPQDELCSSLLEVLDAQYGDLTSEQRSCLISDIHLSVQATNGRGDDALDLINLLRRLDSDSSSVAPELGVFHAPPQSPVLDNHKAAAAVPTKLRVVLPSGPPSPPPPPSKAKIKPAVAKQLANEWQQVPQRKVWSSLPSSHVHHIPAYAHDVNGFQVKKNRVSQGGKDDNGEVAVYKSKMVAALKKRDKILMEAAKYWRRGNSNTKGGEVALFYAQQVSLTIFVISTCTQSFI